jgi:2,6-dihydroxypseudooxynicotine hydrolase
MQVNQIQQNLIYRSSRYVVSGMDINDLNRIVPKVNSWEDWRLAVSEMAKERRDLGHEAHDAGHRITAGEHFVSAAVYYHFAQLGYFENETKKRATAAESRAIHRLAFDLVDPPVQQLCVSFRGVQLLANVRVPRGIANAASVILLPGADSTKEEMITFESVFHKRSLATVAFEGPGQGAVGETMPLIEDYESAVATLINHLEAIPGIDSKRIGLYGRSLGGHLAPRVAALESRIRAVTSAGGFYDLGRWDEYSEQLKRFFCHAWGYEGLAEGAERAKRTTLDGLVGKIRCPFLILHSDSDPVVSGDEGRRMAAEATCDTKLVIYPEGDHVCDNIPYKYRPQVADWFADKLMQS